jgi:hypothetical protein
MVQRTVEWVNARLAVITPEARAQLQMAKITDSGITGLL